LPIDVLKIIRGGGWKGREGIVNHHVFIV